MLLPRTLRLIGLVLVVVAACARPFAGYDPELDPPPPIDVGSGDGGGGSLRPGSWVDVLTQHNDALRTGANLHEGCLRPENVARLRERRRFRVQGQVYAQPLIANGSLVVATTENEVASFDLDAAEPTRRWTVGQEVFGTPATVVRNVNGPLGILSTPAIDLEGDRLFVVARRCPSRTALLGCSHSVYALRLSTGEVLDRADVAPPGFLPDWQWNRPGLLLQKGLLYVAWGAGQSGNEHEEEMPYHGWMMAFRADDLKAPPIVHSTTPHGRAGGIWQCGAGVLGDGDAVFVTTGNSVRDSVITKPNDFPDKPVDDENSTIRLRFDENGIAERVGYYDPRPYKADGNVFQYMERWDIDFSSAGPALIPGTDDIVVGSKSGIMYLLDRKTLAALQPPLSAFTDPPMQAGESLYIYYYGDGPHVVGAPVVWGDSVYAWARSDRLAKFHHDRAARTLVVEAKGTDKSGPGGGILSLSADGAKDGTIFAVLAASASGGAPAELAAYDAVTLEKKWSVTQLRYAKFVAPTVSGGHVFLPTWNTDGTSDVIDYGLRTCD